VVSAIFNGTVGRKSKWPKAKNKLNVRSAMVGFLRKRLGDIDMKFRKKPVVIEAFRYNVDPRPDWFTDRVSDNSILTYSDYCKIHTLEGWHRAEAGDMIIRGVKGEIYPCKPDIFEMTYEAAE
jgi:hypothetical protein